jgi:hypothetical protein
MSDVFVPTHEKETRHEICLDDSSGSVAKVGSVAQLQIRRSGFNVENFLQSRGDDDVDDVG